MRFKKPLVSAGLYTVPTSDGSRKVAIDPERLAHWTSQFNKMKEKGISVPAPWAHSKDSLPIQMGNDGTLPRSDMNAGWWNKMWVEDNTLWGELEVPQNEDAIKIGKNVRESSIYVRPQFEDGGGNIWNDSLMHIALVTHPVENGQDNFQPIEMANGDEISLAMSQLTEPLSMATKVEDVRGVPVGSSVKDVLEALRANRIDLPDDTDDDNFMERLMTALRQKKVSESPEEESITKQPEGAKEQPAPVAMSQTKDQKNEVQGVEKNQDAVELVMSHPKYQAAQQTIQFLLNHLGEQAKTGLSERRDNLISGGKITEEYAQQHLDPAIEAFQMSFGDDGKQQGCSAATIMEALESAPSLTGSILSGTGQLDPSQLALAMSQAGMELPEGLKEEGLPMKSATLNSENADEVALEFLKNTGHVK